MTRVLLESEMVERWLTVLLQETTQAHFLRTLAMHEVHPFLEERRKLGKRLLSVVTEEPTLSRRHNAASLLMMDHYYTLLEAELAWLDRTISSLCSNRSTQRS